MKRSRLPRERDRINGVADKIEFRVGSVDEATPSADLVCANLTADVILPMLQTLLNLTCGKLILSGILETQLQLVTDELQQHGVSDFEVKQDGEWVCCVVYSHVTTKILCAARARSITKAVILQGDEARHLREVLRLRVGDEVNVFDGAGKEFRCTVAAMRRDEASLENCVEVEPSSQSHRYA